MTAFPQRIGFEQALAIVNAVARQQPMPQETLSIARAHGRVLAEDLHAPIALPPFDNSAMDGFALRHADAGQGGARLRLIGEQFADVDAGLHVSPGQCARITTGAPLPAGADSVVMKEHVRVDGDFVHVEQPPRPGQYVRRMGEDVAAGDRVLQAGQRLTPPRVALAAALGLASVRVSRRPTVAVFTTGDELVEPGVALQPGQIYNSNRELLIGLLRADGLEPTAWPNLPDDPDRLRAMLADAASSFDVVLTCGAVSAGEKDHIPELAQRHGRVHFWKVRMKPGMPLLFATLDRACLLALPGNPVSVLATYCTLARPLLDALQGCGEAPPPWHAQLASAWIKRHERLEFLRGSLQSDANGVLRVHPNAADGSHRMAAAAHSDALIVLPEGLRDYAQGDAVRVLPLRF